MMLRQLFISVLLLLGVIGAAAGEQTAFTLEFDGMERSYGLYVPDSYDGEQPVPLLIALHPSGGDAESMAAITGFNALAEQEGFIAAYPEGPYGYWDYGADLPEWAEVAGVLDDPGFIAALVETLEAEYTIDPARIYAVGYSNGARMAFRLGCSLADKLAAVGAVAATISDDVTGGCPEDSRVSVIYLHGTQDSVTPWNGKPLFMPDGTYIADALSAFDTAQFWAGQNGCDSEPALAYQEDDNPNDQRSVQRALYTGCDKGVEVAFYGFTGAGHSWQLSQSINTAELIWSFFETHPRAEDES